VLADLPGVCDAVVVSGTDSSGDACLLAYVVLDDDEDLDAPAELMRQLSERLPAYLVPAVLVPVEELPLSASGKVDRSRLPAPEPTEW
jgi:acyl-CoA synthetase (AMP-forming)/AMP-acid ligase II